MTLIKPVRLLVIVSVLLMSGCTATSVTPTMFTCGGLEREPAEFTPYCADAGQIFRNIRWDEWGPQSAQGVAQVDTNLCEPTCAEGSTFSTSAEIHLSSPVTNDEGEDVFSRMRVEYEESIPGHSNPEEFELPTTGTPLGSAG